MLKEALRKHCFYWSELEFDKQQQIALRFKQEMLDMLNDEPYNVPKQYATVVEETWNEVNDDSVPWFFVETLLKKTMPSGITVESHIDNIVKDLCETTVYYNSQAIQIRPI